MGNNSKVKNQKSKVEKLILFTSVLALVCLFPSVLPAEITTYEARNHIDSLNTVCGFCVGGVVEVKEKGSPTYLYFEYMHTKSVFIVKIWDFDRKKFPEPPELMYKNKAICVTGKIESESDKPFINVIEPGQIEPVKQYEIQSPEEALLEESAKFHEILFKPKDRIAVKILLKALGYKIDRLDDKWGMDAYRAVITFEKANKLPVNGKMQRKDFFVMEKVIAADKRIDYVHQKEYFNLIQKLLKRQM